jgi:hypothetical protein
VKRITTPVPIAERLENAALDVMTARDPETRKAALARFRLLQEMAAREELAAHRATMRVVADHSGDAHR